MPLKPPKEAYCGKCRKWIPIKNYRWGQYKCKPCARAYDREWKRKRRAAAKEVA